MLKKCKYLLMLMLSVATSLQAYTYLEDDFDDGTVDPWIYSYDANMGGATYYESGGSLTITDIIDLHPEINYGARIFFSQTLSYGVSNDFHADYQFSWNEYNDPNARQILQIKLLSTDGHAVADVAFQDAWPTIPGRMNAFIYNETNTYLYSGLQNMPYSGSADIDIDRVGDTVSIAWDDTTLLSGVNTEEVVSVLIMVWHGAWTSGVPMSFGDFDIEYINLTGDAPLVSTIPEPASLVLLGVSIISFMIRRKK